MNDSSERGTSERDRRTGDAETGSYDDEDVYVSVDIEADGPIPGVHSMLSLGASLAWGTPTTRSTTRSSRRTSSRT